MIKAIVGPMFGEKSSRLIDIANNLEKEGKKFKVFFPASCNKKEGYIYSRKDNKKIKAIKVFNIDDLFNNITDEEVILIDEFTFLCSHKYIDLFMSFLEQMDRMGKDVILSGLQLDYLGNSFDLTREILPYCDEIVMTSAVCEICGAPATRQVRKVNGVLDVSDDSPTLLMEDNDIVYMPVCRSCFREVTGLSAIKKN